MPSQQLYFLQISLILDESFLDKILLNDLILKSFYTAHINKNMNTGEFEVRGLILSRKNILCVMIICINQEAFFWVT